MLAEWIFRTPSRAEKQREAVQGEFFANESIENEAQALVREGIQNSLDAALDLPDGDKEKVTVRIKVSGGAGALGWNDVSPIFAGAWDHFEADGSGLREPPNRMSKCPYLVFEDFGTKGLVGDTDAYMRPPEGEDNPFYFYMRAEGQSNKTGSDRGRWGVGKFVFPRASRVRSFIALSHRLDDQRTVIAGQCILKWHQIDGAYFSPDGWFGLRGPDDFGLPVDDAATAQKIRNLFALHRNGETGLSLIVPWIHPELDEVALTKAVVKDFYFPILRNKLDVVISGPRGETSVSELTFEDVVRQLDEKDELDADIKGTIALAAEAAGRRVLTDFRLMANANRRPIWTEEILPEDRKEKINRKLKDSRIVSIEVPVWVRKKGEADVESNITIWLQRDKTATGGRPVYIRDGLVIPGVRASIARGYRSLVLIEDRPMANLLGDAENPSHTQWDAKSENFEGKYTYGSDAIIFVRTSVKKLIDLLSDQDEEPDILALADLFPDPTLEPEGPDPDSGERPDSPDPGTPPLPPVPPLPSPRVRIAKIKDGFVVTGFPDRLKGAHSVSVSCAYDRAKGSPIKRWKPEDFELGQSPISIQVSGNDFVSGSLATKGNTLKCRVNGGDFRMEVTGFDPHRDLFIGKVGLQEIKDGSA